MANARLREKIWSNTISQFSGGLWLNEGTNVPDETFSPFMENLDPLVAGGVQKRAPLRLNYKVLAGANKESLYYSSFMQGPMVQWLQADPTSGSRYAVIDWFANSTANIKLKLFDYTTSTIVWTAALAAPLNNLSSFDFASSDAGANWYVHNYTTAVTSAERVTTAGVVTALGVSFNDNISAPTNGNMFNCRVATQHLAAYYFLGSTIEGGTTFANRLRWSHPGRFEDYRTNDKLDIGDASNIIGLYSVQETLVIVKENSVWVLTGYDPNTFQVRKVADLTYSAADATTTTSRMSGASSSHLGAFIYVQGNGVYHWDGKKWEDVSGGIKDAIIDSRVTVRHMAVVGDTLYMSAGPAFDVGVATTTADKSWEYNVRRKFWTQHNAPFTGLAPMQTAVSGMPSAYAVIDHGSAVGANVGYSFVYYRQQVAAGSWVDNWTGSNVEIVCKWRSPWQIADNPARKKRFKKTQFVFNKRPNASASDPASYSLTIYKDWDGIHPTKTATINSAKALDTTDYNTLRGYGHAVTGSDFDERDLFSAPGSGYAMQVLVSSASTPFDQWGFDSVVFKYAPRMLK